MIPQDIKKLVREFVPPTREAQLIRENRGVLNERLVKACLRWYPATLYIDKRVNEYYPGCVKFTEMGFEAQLSNFYMDDVKDYGEFLQDCIVATGHFSFKFRIYIGGGEDPYHYHYETLVKPIITFLDLLNFIKEIEAKQRFAPANFWFDGPDRSHVFLEFIRKDHDGRYVCDWGS